jgi:hypothetical protein
VKQYLLNRAVAVAETDDPAAALTVVDGLGLDGYYVFHAIRADLLRRLGHHADRAPRLPGRAGPYGQCGRTRLHSRGWRISVRYVRPA